MFLLRYFLPVIFFFSISAVYAQQDMELHLNSTFLQGKNVLKVKRNFNDPYLWVLAQGNQVYRIHSVTKIVDDYSSQFSAYSGFQFIDIAGVSPDQVYVATNTNSLIEYKGGVLKNIDTADGIAGNINSIGIDYTSDYLPDNSQGMGGRYAAPNVTIGTNTGMCHYNYQTGLMLPTPSHVEARVFEAIYRSIVFSDLEYGEYFKDVVKQYPVVLLTSVTTFGGWLWYGDYGDFGNHINTAYITDGALRNAPLDYLNTYRMNLLWGTDKGLFVNDRNYSYSYMWGCKRFLDHIPVNKITSIYGLKAFGEGVVKENILAGTKQGLYFSTSGYNQFGAIIKPDYTFFHYDELGNKNINDICVNATSYAVPICEDGIWVAADDGLYLLKPDYAPYIKTTAQVQAIQFDGQAYNVKELQTCGAAAIKASVSPYVYNGSSIQWYKDGVELPNQSGVTLTITSGGEYHAILYDPCSNVHFESNHLKVTVLSGPVFTFDYPDKLSFCDGSTGTLQTENNPNYQYRWYKDGVLNGNNTYLQNVSKAGKYKLEVSACSGSWFAAKEVQVDFIKMPMPTISADRAAYCAGDEAVLIATVPLDASAIKNWQPYQYRWYKDGVPLNSVTSPSLKTTQPGKYRVDATSCSQNTGTSAEFQLNFITLTPPVITASKPAYCMGDQATLSVSLPNSGTYTVNWIRDGVTIASGPNKASIVTIEPGTYTVNISNALTACSQTSTGYALIFENLPVINLQRIINTTLCDGQTVDLQASYSGGTIKWSTGETSDRISVKQSGTFTASVKTLAGCTVDKALPVQFLPNPVLSVPDATLCQFTNDQLTLTAPAGFAKYEWNGQTGGQTYVTGKLGTVNLTVTDQNGCKASQAINITSRCKDIHIPNTFTPNGDGINDKWTITGLEVDPTVNVKIYNRLGELLFQSQGYATPWDGTRQNRILPAGVYYYVIHAHGSNRVLSGSVSMVY